MLTACGATAFESRKTAFEYERACPRLTVRHKQTKALDQALLTGTGMEHVTPLADLPVCGWGDVEARVIVERGTIIVELRAQSHASPHEQVDSVVLAD
jgi:hypothetical protein